MQLDPKTSMILNIVLFALQSLAGATWISGYLDPHWAGLIMGLLGWVTTVLNFVLHAYSPNVAGPLARSMLLIAAAGVALTLLMAPAGAQTKRAAPASAPAEAPALALPKPPLCDPLNLIPGCRNADGSINQKSSVAGNPFDNLTDDVLKKILADVTYAKALAKSASNDVTLPCWTAWVDVVTAQTAPLKDDAGNVLTQPDPHFFVAAERASEFINQIQPNSKLYIGCSAALNQSKMAIGQLISAVLSGGALGLFKLPIP